MYPVLFARLYWLVYLRLSSVYSTAPTVRVIVVMSSSVSACFCLSQYPLPQCTYDPSGFDPRLPLNSDYCLPSMYLSPVIPELNPCLPTDPTWITFDITDYRQTNFGLFGQSFWLLCGFYNKPLVSSWTWSCDWFLYTSPDTYNQPFNYHTIKTMADSKTCDATLCKQKTNWT